MNRIRHLLAIGALFLAAMPGSALACDWPGQREDPAAIERYTRDIIRDSAAIIDAEVVVPSGGGTPARLRALRVLKGPALAVFLVDTPSNCDVYFPRVGERLRIILSGGPERFTASMPANGPVFPSRAGRRRFYSALDAQLGVPRPHGVTAPGGE